MNEFRVNIKVKDILRNGDICEVKRFIGQFDFGETIALCIDGKLYENLTDGRIYEINDNEIEDKVIRIFRPIKMKDALKAWRFLDEETWRSYRNYRNKFKTVYIDKKLAGLTLNILKDNLTYVENRIIDCVRSALGFNPELDLKRLWELINTTIHPLLKRDEHGIAYTGRIILITRMKDAEYIAEIIENE